jgi:hypothetical protein
MPKPVALAGLDVAIGGAPRMYEMAVRVQVEKSNMDSVCGGPDAADRVIAPVLTAAAQRYMETDPKAVRFTELTKERARLCERHEQAIQAAEQATREAEADGADDQATIREVAAARTAKRLGKQMEAADTELASLRQDVARGQRAAVCYAFTEITTQAREEMAAALRTFLAGNAVKVMTWATLLGKAPYPTERFHMRCD